MWGSFRRERGAGGHRSGRVGRTRLGRVSKWHRSRSAQRAAIAMGRQAGAEQRCTARWRQPGQAETPIAGGGGAGVHADEGREEEVKGG